jgi:hypothetical protein
MNRYIIPKIFCTLGALVIFSGVFLSELNITLGDFLISGSIAVGITMVLLILAILAFKMKISHKKKIRKTIPCRFVEVLSILLFVISGLASLLIFNHCITVWQRSGEIQKNLNIRQLENMLPEYEKYANQRIANYERQTNDAIRFRNSQPGELTNLGFNTSLDESLANQKARKIEKLKQILRPHTYKNLTDTITTNIAKFVGIVEDFSPITAPKNITRIEEWAKHYEVQLIGFSHYKMKGENAEDFQFESTFGNVKEILTKWNDFFSPKRYTGYFAGIISLILMVFPYFWGNRSIKFRKN